MSHPTRSQPASHYLAQGIQLPITTEFRQISWRFAQQCPFSEKAEQIQRNTLAVCAVNAYLQLMGISTDLSGSDSWNPMMQAMADTADLKVPGLGILSCRALHSTDTACYVPPEAWHNRVGYIAVAIDQAANEATLLGFTPTVEIEQVPLDRFEPIEALIDVVHMSDSVVEVVEVIEQATQQAPRLVTRLGQWVEDAIVETWQAVETLINPADVGFAFRTTDLATRSSATDISRAKMVDLGLRLGHSVQVALVIHLTRTAAAQTDLILQVRPLGDSPYLTEGLSLIVLDENGEIFMSAIARDIDNYIQLRLSGQSGESFTVLVTVGENTFEEQFII
ncbi:MAG: DUF1822 family protein [Phormidesmis sp.]